LTDNFSQRIQKTPGFKMNTAITAKPSE